MAKNKPVKVKHIPQRTCAGCRQVMPKRSMIRIVRTPEGVQIDPTGKTAGRGAYLHNLHSCWERGLKGSLEHALKTEISERDLATLKIFSAGLPVEPAVNETVDKASA